MCVFMCVCVTARLFNVKMSYADHGAGMLIYGSFVGGFLMLYV